MLQIYIQISVQKSYTFTCAVYDSLYFPIATFRSSAAWSGLCGLGRCSSGGVLPPGDADLLVAGPPLGIAVLARILLAGQASQNLGWFFSLAGWHPKVIPLMCGFPGKNGKKTIHIADTAPAPYHYIGPT